MVDIIITERKPVRTPDKIRDDAIAHFCTIAIPKFNAGQKEHGGCLDERVTIRELEEEVVDLFFYLQSLKERQRHEIKRLRAEAARWKEIAQR